jgi:hypothetical protein
MKGLGPEGVDSLTTAGNEAGLRVGQAVAQLYSEMKRLETLQKAQQVVSEELTKQSSWTIGGVKLGMDTLDEDPSKKDMTHFSPEVEAEAKSDQQDAQKMLSQKVPETRTQLHEKVRQEEPETTEKLFKEKVSHEILKMAGSKEEKKLIEESLRRSGYPIRRSQVWDVGDVLGKEKGKEEVLPGMVVLPTTKKASEDKEAGCASPSKPKKKAKKKVAILAGVPRPFDQEKVAQNPMLEGGQVRYTVGPTPEDVAQYMRTQQKGGQIGETVGMGLGALGGGALGYMGGKSMQGMIDSPGLARLAIPVATLLGALGGAGIGRGLGERVGRRAGGHLTSSPAVQMQMPYLGQGRTGEMAQQLAQLSAMRGASAPTVAVSPGMGYA